MKVKIMLVDDNEEFIKEVKDHFDGSEEYEVISSADNGEKAIAALNKEKPDVLILDLVMPKIDGFGVLEYIREHNLKEGMKIIIISALSHDTFIAKSMNLGADYFMRKPVNMANLTERITESAIGKIPAAPVRVIKNKSVEEKITNIFITVGIPAHIKGYQFLREAIKMAIENPDIINSITKKLYPEVAKRFCTSPSKVERAIRHAIEVAWNRGKIENINSLFGVRVYNHNEKPTNGEFIALVADKMLLESV